MNKIVLLFIVISLNSFGQSNPTEKAKPIVEEGKRMYRAEMASWYGTDLFLENYKNRENIGGYFSYTDNDTSRCIFFSRNKPIKVIGTISFDSTYNTNTAIVNIEERDFEHIEVDLYEIRKRSLNLIQNDTLFKVYNNTNLNLIPLIYNEEKKVYVLTGPTQSGVVIFGNDYLITFNKKNEIVSKRQLHKNIIPIEYGQSEDNKEIVGAMHSHLPETGDFITSTDICTLMLYSKFAGWKTHNVVSKKYLNIWNCETNTLTVIPMDTVNKINKDQEKRKEKEKKKKGSH